jgi:energy-coupling factor transporter ATP-binding protein EcfA2
MKLPFIKFSNHPILGDLEIDFRKDTTEKIVVCKEDDPYTENMPYSEWYARKVYGGYKSRICVPTPQKGNQYPNIINQDNIYDNILFVGENGCGKTTLLHELDNYNESKFIEYQFDKSKVELHSRYTEAQLFGFPGTFQSHFLSRDIKYDEGRVDERNDIYKAETEGRNTVSGDMVSWLKINRLSIDELNRFFGNDRLAKAFEKAYPFQIPHSMRVTTYEEMRGKPETMIDYIQDLSSGEQEILLRLLYFFKDNLSQCSDIILIDEPESGLHPKWQLKILEYYKYIFASQENPGWLDNNGEPIPPIQGKQKLQLFLATHSENILKSAIEQNDWLIVRLYRDEQGNVKSQRIENADRCLQNISFAEIQYIVFGIATNDYHNELYGHLQNKTGNEESIKDFDVWMKTKNFIGISQVIKESGKSKMEQST